MECPVKDWKESASTVLRPPGSWHFKFNESKRFIITKNAKSVLVRREAAFKSDIGEALSVCKRWTNVSRINPHTIISGVKINEFKIRDVNSLLMKHFGNNPF